MGADKWHNGAMVSCIEGSMIILVFVLKARYLRSLPGDVALRVVEKCYNSCSVHTVAQGSLSLISLGLCALQMMKKLVAACFGNNYIHKAHDAPGAVSALGLILHS